MSRNFASEGQFPDGIQVKTSPSVVKECVFFPIVFDLSSESLFLSNFSSL